MNTNNLELDIDFLKDDWGRWIVCQDLTMLKELYLIESEKYIEGFYLWPSKRYQRKRFEYYEEHIKPLLYKMWNAFKKEADFLSEKFGKDVGDSFLEWTVPDCVLKTLYFGSDEGVPEYKKLAWDSKKYGR